MAAGSSVRDFPVSAPTITIAKVWNELLLLFNFFYLNMYMCARECAYHLSMCIAHGDQKTESDPWKLELQMFVSHHGDGGHRTQVFCKSSPWS